MEPVAIATVWVLWVLVGWAVWRSLFGQLDPVSIPWVQLGLGGALAVSQFYILWRLLFRVRPEEAKAWQEAIASNGAKIDVLSGRIDAVITTTLDRQDKQEDARRKEMREWMTRLDLMAEANRKEVRDIVEAGRTEMRDLIARHAEEMRVKRHEFLNAQQASQKYVLEVLSTIVTHTEQTRRAAKETSADVKEAKEAVQKIVGGPAS